MTNDEKNVVAGLSVCHTEYLSMWTNADAKQKVSTAEAENEHIETIVGSTGFNDALIREHPTLMSSTTMLLFACSILGCLCQ